MSGAMPPLPNTPSWRDDQIKSTGITLPFNIILYLIIAALLYALNISVV
jgi:hypothetical protein